VGLKPGVIRQARVKRGEGVAGKIVMTGQPVLVQDIENSKRFKKSNDKKYYTKSFLSAPLLVKSEVIGVINLNNKINRTIFTQNDLNLLNPLLDHIAVTVKNYILIEKLNSANTALKKKMDMLTTLFDVSQDVIRVTDTAKLLNEVLLKTLRLLKGNSGSLMLWNKRRSRLEIRASVGLNSNMIKYFQVQKKGQSVAYWVAQNGKPLLLIGELKNYPQFSHLSSNRRKIKSVISVPLTVREEKPHIRSAMSVPLERFQKVIGVININRKPGMQDFTSKDLEFLSVLSFQVAVAVENTNLIIQEKKAMLELRQTKGKLEKAIQNIGEELEMAKSIQQSFLPPELPQHKDYSIAAAYLPCGTIGGDLYDVISLENGNLGFLISDVSGHGVPAALVTAMAKTVFNRYFKSGNSPKEILEKVNQDLMNFMIPERYLTALVGILDVQKLEFTYSKASHPPVLLVQPQYTRVLQLNTKGVFIGLFENGLFEEKKITINHGDKMIFFTDGLIEGLDQEEEQFGIKRLESVLLESTHLSAQEIVNLIISRVKEFIGSVPMVDDITLLVVDVH